jgi:hypothetical protein
MSKNVDVKVYAPTGTDSALVEKVKSALVGYDRDGQVEVDYYTGDFDDVVRQAVQDAATTPGGDIAAILTNLEGDDIASVPASLAKLPEDAFAFVVPFGVKGDKSALIKQIDDQGVSRQRVDVVEVSDLDNASVVGAELDDWYKKQA